MATTDTVEIKFSLRDEISAAARKAVSEIMKVNDLRTDRARQQLNLMERASQGVGRELRSLATLSGITGFLGAGGLVAGLVAASKSLTDFAQQGIRTHYTARQLGISVDALERYTDGLKVLGQSEQEAQSGIKSAIEMMEEAAHKGTQSRLFEELSKGVKGTGVQLYNDVMRTYGREGPEKALHQLVTRISGMSRETQAHLSKFMGFGNLAVADLIKILPRLHPLIHINKDQLLEYNLQWVNTQRAWQNIKTTIGVALLPAFEELYKAIQKYLESEAGAKMLERVKGWINSLTAWVSSEGFAKQIEDIAEGAQTVVVHLGQAFTAADAVVKGMGTSWVTVFELLVATKILTFLFGLRRGLMGLGPYMWILVLAAEALKARRDRLHGAEADADPFPNRLPYTTEDLKMRMQGGDVWDRLRDRGKGSVLDGIMESIKKSLRDAGLLGQQSSLSGGGGGTQLSDLAVDRAAKRELGDKFAGLDYEVAKLVSFLMPGGPESGLSPSGYQFSRANPDAAQMFLNYSPSATLALDRSKFAPQMNESVIKMIAAMGNREVGGSGSAAAYLHVEALLNRLSSQTGAKGPPSIASAIQSNYYQPFKEGGYQKEMKTITPANVDSWRPIINAAMGGINTGTLGTGTASGPESAFSAKAGFFGQGAGRGFLKMLGGEIAGEEAGTQGWRERTGARLAGERSLTDPLGGFSPRMNYTPINLDAIKPRMDRSADGGGEPVEGSANVDIDIGETKSSSGGNRESLFQPQVIEYTPQMAKTGSDRAAPSLFNSQ